MKTDEYEDRYAAILRTVRQYYPAVQAIYLFGSYGTENEWPDSDVDIAILLPPAEAKGVSILEMADLRLELELLLGRDVDLVNLRQATMVLRKEVLIADRRIFCADVYAADEFDMLTISFYQCTRMNANIKLHPD